MIEFGWGRVLILCPSRGGLESSRCMASVRRCLELGARVETVEGCSDQVGARNILFSRGLAAADTDVLLLLDDDVEFSVDDARTLCEHSLRCNDAVTGVYQLANGQVAIEPLDAKPGRYLSGLGFMAVARENLATVASGMPVVQVGKTGQKWPLLCAIAARPMDDGTLRYTPIDHWFCLTMGGVLVNPDVIVAHNVRVKSGESIKVRPARDAVKALLATVR